jgi:hypothetical protein
MSISVVQKAAALLESLSPQQLAELPPAHRQRLASSCQRVLQMVEMMTRPAPPRSGVLLELKAGIPRHE